jgi:uncharacterized membrane protein
MSKSSTYTKWRHTRQGQALFVVIYGVIFYYFASRAIDTASYWHYLFAIAALIMSLASFVGIFETPKVRKSVRK